MAESYHQRYPDQQIKLFGFKFFSRKFDPPIIPDGKLNYRLIRWFPGRIYTGLFKKGLLLPIDLLIWAKRSDVIIFPNFVRWPVAFNDKTVTFIHDLSFELFGEFSSPPNREYMKKYVPKSIEKSRHIITISESSKKDIERFYNVPAKKISVVHAFVDDIFYKRSQGEIDEIRIKYNLPKNYILFVSSIEPRKNIAGILSAYSKLDKKLQKKYGLVLAGGKGWLNEDIHLKADELIKSGSNIVRTGYVPDCDLPALYSGATMFLFPTFYEGFGIPPLEAMACGIPVVTSNNSSLPEVVGDAGILVDANNTHEIIVAVTSVLNDKKLANDLIVKGYKQAKLFSPEKSAEELHKVITKLSNTH